MLGWLPAAAAELVVCVVAAWRVAEVVVTGGVVPIIIWAIELVRVLELAASAFPGAEDSARAQDRIVFQMRPNSSSRSPMCFQINVISPANLAAFSRLILSSSWAFSSRELITFN